MVAFANPKANRLGKASGRTDAKIEKLQRGLQELEFYYNSGQLLEVENRARRLAKKFPRSYMVFNILGVALAGQEKFDKAIASYQRALKVKPDYADALNNLANALNNTGKFDEAIANYERALKINPDYPDAHFNFANSLRNLGKFEEAVAGYRQALKLKPDYGEAYANLGIVLTILNEFEQAVVCFQQAIKCGSQHADVDFHYGNALMYLGKYEEAVARYQIILESNPDFAEAHSNLGVALKNLGRFEEAAQCYQKALQIKPDYSRALTNFAETLRNIKEIDVSPFFKELIIRCFESPEIESDAINAVSMALISKVLKPQIEAEDISQVDFSSLDNQTSGVLIAHLRNSAIISAQVESFLTNVRRVFLERFNAASEDKTISDTSLELLDALALQSFLNEYIWYVSDEEHEKIDVLQRHIIQTIADGGTPGKYALFLFASYRPLHTIEDIRIWASSVQNQADDAFKHTLQQLIVNPSREKEIAKNIEQLTSIDDNISVAVQSQYENNPYPRWDSLSVMNSLQYTQNVLIDIAPNRPHLEPTTDAPKILTAGCGTGKQPITSAFRYHNSSVFAVDLSRTSLAYAIRKAEELQVSNIKFAQADILKLSELDEQFDMIECGGVLHHMAEPEAGLKVLLGLLKPGGFIRLALYSEIAREDIVRLRQLVDGKSIDVSTEGIRKIRRELKNNQPELYQKLCYFRDFFSTSEVRDLLFHVQEHRFTIPQLESLIKGNDLEFLGFHLQDPRIKNSFSEQFPDDPNCLDLENWHQFEQKNPKTFSCMYQFWCRKKV